VGLFNDHVKEFTQARKRLVRQFSGREELKTGCPVAVRLRLTAVCDRASKKVTLWK